MVGKSDFLAPEIQKKKPESVDRAPEQDAFSLAIGIFQLLMDGNHPHQGKWIGQGPRPSLPQRIAKGIWPHSKPAPKNWRPRSFAPPFDILHPLIQDAMTRCFQYGHGDPSRRPSASKWQQLLIDVENDQAYLNKVMRLFQKAAWRRQAPTAVPSFRPSLHRQHTFNDDNPLCKMDAPAMAWEETDRPNRDGNRRPFALCFLLDQVPLRHREGLAL